MLKISLAGSNNSVQMTGLTPCILIVHVIIVAPKKISTPLTFLGAVNGIIAPILHPCVDVGTLTNELFMRYSTATNAHTQYSHSFITGVYIYMVLYVYSAHTQKII